MKIAYIRQGLEESEKNKWINKWLRAMVAALTAFLHFSETTLTVSWENSL